MEQDEREWLMTVYEMMGELLERVKGIEQSVNGQAETKKSKEDD